MATTSVDFTMTVGQLEMITDYLSYETDIVDPEDEEKTIPNPQSRKAFLYKHIQSHLKAMYKAEKSKAGDIARTTALEEAVTETDTLTVTE